MPEFENWDEVIRLYPSMDGIPKEPRQVWVNKQPRQSNSGHDAQKAEDTSTRSEQKARDAYKKLTEDD